MFDVVLGGKKLAEEALRSQVELISLPTHNAQHTKTLTSTMYSGRDGDEGDSSRPARRALHRYWHDVSEMNAAVAPGAGSATRSAATATTARTAARICVWIWVGAEMRETKKV